VNEGGSYGSAWWREMVRICNGVGLAVGSKFDDNLRRKVGEGHICFFGWAHGWGRPLCN